MTNFRVRACIKCKEYKFIITSNPTNQGNIRNFEKLHRGHSLVTLELNEIKKEYKLVTNQVPDFLGNSNSLSNKNDIIT